MMEEGFGSASVREQLIAAGIVELEGHGIADFSLRRVAAACNLSCAAPYKHFKGKEELIEAIFTHIHNQLDLLLLQVSEVYADPERQVVESCLAYIRFCIANPHFRALLMLSGRELPLAVQVKKLVKDEGKGYRLRAVTYGATQLIESGELSYSEQVMQDIRDDLYRQLQ